MKSLEPAPLYHLSLRLRQAGGRFPIGDGARLPRSADTKPSRPYRRVSRRMGKVAV